MRNLIYNSKMYEYIVLCAPSVNMDTLVQHLQSLSLNQYAKWMVVSLREKDTIYPKHLVIQTYTLTHSAINSIIGKFLINEEFKVVHPFQQELAIL